MPNPLATAYVSQHPRKGRGTARRLRARADDGHVEIAVSDTGPGIPSEDLETIFEEFEQTSDGKKAEATGLGLPLSRELVELHGGRLWVESETGQGSTLPLHPPGRARGVNGRATTKVRWSGTRTCTSRRQEPQRSPSF